MQHVKNQVNVGVERENIMLVEDQVEIPNTPYPSTQQNQKIKYIYIIIWHGTSALCKFFDSLFFNISSTPLASMNFFAIFFFYFFAEIKIAVSTITENLKKDYF